MNPPSLFYIFIKIIYYSYKNLGMNMMPPFIIFFR
nr:MAG TPA: hypothetical protein [Caudoviricetes sp.]